MTPARRRKRRQTPVVKFPLRFHCAITIAMGDSLRRMTGGNSLLSESDIGRLALHSYLLSNDPHYHRAMGGRSKSVMAAGLQSRSQAHIEELPRISQVTTVTLAAQR